MEGTVWRRSLVGPLVLIGLGVVFLLNNLGYLGWNVWETILRFWPVLLIAVGVEILLGQRLSWGSIAAVPIVLATAGLMVLLSGVSYLVPGPRPGAAPLTSQAISEALGAAKRAEVEIEAGIGELTLGALGDSAKLVEGTVPFGRGEEVYRDFRLEGDKAFFTLRSRHPRFFWDRRGHGEWSWVLNLNRKVPMRLAIKTGVGVARLDLSQVRGTEIEVKTGVGKTTLTLPAAGVVRARCEGGIGEMTILIPRGMAARIQASHGIGVVEVNGRRLDGVYVSPGYDGAKDRVDLEVKGGIGRIAITEAGW